MISAFAGLVGADRAPEASDAVPRSRQLLRAQTATPLSGVGTSRSALLLTVRVESGIARTKSNNGPRSWLGSVLLMLFWCCETHTHMTSC